MFPDTFTTWYILSVMSILHQGVCKLVTVAASGRHSAPCGNLSDPCATLKLAFLVASDGDTLILNADKHLQEIPLGLEESKNIIVKKSLTIEGSQKTPVLVCKPTYSFLLDGTGGKETITLKFRNLVFRGALNNTGNCRPSSHGVFRVQRADVIIENCSFFNVCVAMHLVNYGQSLRVAQSTFQDVIYALYSKNISNADIALSHCNISGRVHDVGGPSYAISLTSHSNLRLQIDGCVIREASEAVSLTLTTGSHFVSIRNTSFAKNNGQSVVINFGASMESKNTTVAFQDVEFVGNSGFYASNIHLVSHPGLDKSHRKPEISLIRGIFQNNKASTFFGTIYADGVDLAISDSFFANNVAGEYRGAIQGFGGAIYIETKSRVTVVNSKFVNNTCSGFGGTIFSRGLFSCINCSFEGPRKTPVRPLLGDILYATRGLTLINSSWIATAMPGTSKSVIWHPGSPTLEKWEILVSGSFLAQCPVGHNISMAGVRRSTQELTSRLSMSCNACPRNEYSLKSGFVHVHQTNGKTTKYEKISVPCYTCKYGAVCNRGKIKAKSNYFGYVVDKNRTQVQFVSCPPGYCCEGRACHSYDTCKANRNGLLCGRCKEGMSENLVNADCVESGKCDDKWLWVLFVPLGFIYVLFFAYIDKISAFMRKEILWWETQMLLKKSISEFELVDIGESNAISSAMRMAKERKFIDDAPAASRIAEPRDASSKREPDLFTDLVNICFYFYQMVLLVRTRDNIKLSYLISLMRGAYSSVFTLSVQGSPSLTVCPLPGLTSVGKLLLIRSFAAYVVGLIIVLHALTVIIGRTSGKLRSLPLAEYLRDFTQTFSVRLKIATIQILTIVYASLTTTLFILVNCIPVHGHAVLFIDGTLRCYVWWQIIVAVLICGWVLPFPLTLVLSTIELKKQKISYNKFVVAWTFPLLYLGIQLLSWLYSRAKREIDGDPVLEEKPFITEIIARLECSFRQSSTCSDKKRAIAAGHRSPAGLCEPSSHAQNEAGVITYPEPVVWQGIMIGRRLVLIFIFTFINNPVPRLYCALSACVLFLIHHLCYRPYVLAAVNIIDTVSSTALVAFCSMNLFFAYAYVSDTSADDVDETMSEIFRWLEAFVLAIIPSLVCCLFMLLILTRLIVLATSAVLALTTMCFGCMRRLFL